MTTPMSPQQRAAALRAARGDIQPSSAAPMGIRYLTRPTPPVPAKPRPAWAELLSAVQLVNDEPAEQRRPARQNTPSAPQPRPRPRARAATPTRQPAAAAAPTTAAAVVPPTPTAPRVVASHPMFACLTCGSRYRVDALDHGCGLLTPVTVTITTQPAPSTTDLLGSYDAFGCEACGDRYGVPVDGHGCGPLTPVTVTIARRGGDTDA